MFAKSPALPLHTPTFSTYQPFYTSSTSGQPVDYAKFFGLSHLKHTPAPAPQKPRTRPPKPEIPSTYHQPSDPQHSPKSELTQKNKELMHQYSSHVLSPLLESDETSSSQIEETSTDEESFFTLDSEKELADVSKLLIVQPSTGSNEPSPSSPPQTLIIYVQFLGEATAANEQTRREFHLIKHCSLQIKDLDFHYKRMSPMYYKLNGFNDPSLKHVFVASLPKEIQPEL